MTEPIPHILFVCLGNICRSPMAEGLARRRFADAGIAAAFDSAGIGDWHAGAPPDRRAVNACWKALVDLSAQRARQIEPADFERFDHIVAMDAENVAELVAMAPPGHAAKISRILDFAALEEADVPDPYYGGHEGFDEVLGLIDAGLAGLMRHVGGG